MALDTLWHCVTIREYAQLYGASERTVKRWKAQGQPLDDGATYAPDHRGEAFALRSLEFAHRTEQPAALEVISPPTLPTPLVPLVETDPDQPDEGTLQRLEQAGRLAYQRYIDTGGSDRAAQIWLAVTDQLRKLKDSQAKLVTDVSESETRFMGTCGEVIQTLHIHLRALPSLIGRLCEGLDRVAIEAKAEDQLERTIKGAVESMADVIRGTSLEMLLPAEEERGR